MRRVVTMVRDPVAWILVIAGVVEMISGGTAARGAVLFAGAALILLDRIRVAVTGRAERRVTSGAPLPAVAAAPLPAAPVKGAVARPGLLAGAVIVAGVLAVLDVQTWPMTAFVGAIGLLAVGWAWSTRPGTAALHRPPTLALGAWAVLVLALGLWELVALLQQPTLETMSYDHPTISYLMEPVLATYPGRFVVLIAWLAAGRGLVDRA